jgi:hypothetical protein
MAVAWTLPTGGDNPSTANSTTYDTASITVSTDDILAVLIFSVRTTATPSSPTLSKTAGSSTLGSFHDAVETAAQTNTDGYRVTLSWVQVTAGGTVTLRATHAASCSGCHIVVLRVTGVDLTAPIGQHTNVNNGSGSLPSYTVAGTLGTSGMIEGSSERRNPSDFGTESGWVQQVVSGLGTPAHGYEVSTKTSGDNTFVAASGTNATWQGVMAEFLAPVTSQNVSMQVITNLGAPFNPKVVQNVKVPQIPFVLNHGPLKDGPGVQQRIAAQKITNLGTVFTPAVNQKITVSTISLLDILLGQNTGGTHSTSGLNNPAITVGASVAIVPAVTAAAVDLYLDINFSPTDGVTVELLDTSITVGTVLASGTLANANITAPGMNRFTFSAPVALSAGTTYYIRAKRTGSSDPTNYFKVWFSSTDLVPEVQGYYSSTFHPNEDLRFYLYVNNAIAFKPALKLVISAQKITETVTVYNPTLTVGSVSVVAQKITETITVYNPAISTGAQNIVVQKITNLGVLFNPQVVQDVKPNVITETKTVYSPKVQLNINAQKITNLGVLFNPKLVQYIAVQKITETVTVRNPSIVQDIKLAVITETKTVYNPKLVYYIAAQKITETVTVRNPAITVGSVSVVAQKITETKTVYNPAVVEDIKPTVITETKSVYNPKVQLNINVQKITNLGVLFNPKVVEDIVVQKITETVTVRNPTITVGSVSVVVQKITETKTVYNPKLVYYIAVQKITRTVTVYNPSFSISVNKVTNLGTVFSPKVVLYVKPALITETKTVYNPKLVQYIAAQKITNLGTVLTPKVVGDIYPQKITETVTVRNPTITVGAVSIVIQKITSLGVPFSPVVSAGGALIVQQKITNLGVLFNPAIVEDVKPQLITETKTVYSPKVQLNVKPTLITETTTVYSPKLVLYVKLGLLSETKTVYQPVVVGSTNTVVAQKISQLGVVFQPAATFGPVTIGTQLIPPFRLIPPRAPAVKTYVKPLLVTSTRTLYAPQIVADVRPSVITHPATVQSPSIAYRIKPTLIQVTPQVLQALVQQVSRQLVIQLISQATQVLPPKVTLGVGVIHITPIELDGVFALTIDKDGVLKLDTAKDGIFNLHIDRDATHTPHIDKDGVYDPDLSLDGVGWFE